MKAVSLFSGVGAFELALQEKGIKTVLSCEIDNYAAKILKYKFVETEIFNGDVRLLKGKYITEKYGKIDIITAGFPCQSFSIAGKREGFKDITRGTLFFEIIRLAAEIGNPAYIFLENVKGLLTHKGGRTFGIILQSLGELGYDVEWQVLNSKDFGVPQNRERVFIVGHLRGGCTRQIFPIRKNDKIYNKRNEDKKKICNLAQTMTARQFASWNGNYIQQLNNISYTNHEAEKVHHGDDVCQCLRADCGGKLKGKGFQGNDLRIRKLTPLECQRLQSFPDNWYDGIEMSDAQKYKQMGNSITVNVLREIFKKL